MEDGKTTNGTSQLRGLMVFHLPFSPALTKVHNALLCSFDYSDEISLGLPYPSSIFLRHLNTLSYIPSINRSSVYFLSIHKRYLCFINNNCRDNNVSSMQFVNICFYFHSFFVRKIFYQKKTFIFQ